MIRNLEEEGVKIIRRGPKFYIQTLSVLIFLLISISSAYSRMITQITPTVTITEEYTDNFLLTDTSTEEEFTTSYGLGFSVGFLDKKSTIYLAYRPEYKDYKNFDDRDGLQHNGNLTGSFQPTKHTKINADLGYDGNNEDNEPGESWQHTAHVSLGSQLTKHTNLTFSQSYAKSFDQQVRTGDYKEHETNTTSTGLRKQFGEKNFMGINFTYEFDNYDNSDADEYTEYTPSGFINYWFTPLNGLESNIEFEKTEFETSSISDIEKWAGDIRYIRKFSRHFDGYLKYRHHYSQRDSGDHHVFHPSLGFDWQVTEDSGISLGIGLLFNEWNNDNDDSTDPFIDIDVYKVFNFSKRGSLSITGSSGYDESNEDAASLGYNTHYKTGFNFSYQLLKRMSSNLFGSYKHQRFHEETVDRRDNTMEIGGGLTWSPLKWLRLNLSGSHSNYNTDAPRGDYKENKVTFSVSFIPEKPIRPDKILSRQTLEKEIF